MSAPGTRILFELGARLHMSASAVEQLSMRELLGWVDYFSGPAEQATNDDAIDLASLSLEERRRMFNHGR